MGEHFPGGLDGYGREVPEILCSPQARLSRGQAFKQIFTHVPYEKMFEKIIYYFIYFLSWH